MKTRNTFSENYNKPFPVALRNLMQSTAKTQKEVSEAIGKTTQSVSQYMNGQSEPGYETLVKIADFFDCSVDYLLGRTDDPSMNPCASDELGLSHAAISSLLECKNKKGPLGHAVGMDAIQALDVLLQNGLFLMALRSFWLVKKLTQDEIDRTAGLSYEQHMEKIEADFDYQDELIDVLIDYSREKFDRLALIRKDDYIRMEKHSAASFFEDAMDDELKAMKENHN